MCIYIDIYIFWYGSTVKFVYSSTNCQASFFLTNPVFIHLWCSNIPKFISISCITQKHTYICVYEHIYMDISICIRHIQPLDITSGMFCQYSLWIALFLNSDLILLQRGKNFIFFILPNPCPEFLLQKIGSNLKLPYLPE